MQRRTSSETCLKGHSLHDAVIARHVRTLTVTGPARDAPLAGSAALNAPLRSAADRALEIAVAALRECEEEASRRGTPEPTAACNKIEKAAREALRDIDALVPDSRKPGAGAGLRGGE